MTPEQQYAREMTLAAFALLGFEESQSPAVGDNIMRICLSRKPASPNEQWINHVVTFPLHLVGNREFIYFVVRARVSRCADAITRFLVFKEPLPQLEL